MTPLSLSDFCGFLYRSEWMFTPLYSPGILGTYGVCPPTPVQSTRCLLFTILVPSGVRTLKVHVPVVLLNDEPSTLLELRIFRWNAAAYFFM